MLSDWDKNSKSTERLLRADWEWEIEIQWIILKLMQKAVKVN